MFLNTLYTISEMVSSTQVISAAISIDATHAIFKGHFPGKPVTPGVVQLQIVREILEKQLGRDLRMKTMRTCKFLQIINPEETPDLNIDIRYTEGETVEVTASGHASDVIYFKAQLSYIEA